MAVESICPGCGKRLRVSDQYAGKQARCPVCGHTYRVPAGAEPANGQAASIEETPEPQAASAEVSSAWFLETPEGRTYGPVARSQLDQWVREGRVDGVCQLREGEQGVWRNAAAVYGVLGRPQALDPDTRLPVLEVSSGGPAARPSRPASRQPDYCEPHRGGLILALGILGWMVPCPVLSVTAWIMGTSNLREMASGRMDRRGRGLAQAGQILGMIQCFLWIGATAVALLVSVLLLVMKSGI